MQQSFRTAEFHQWTKHKRSKRRFQFSGKILVFQYEELAGEKRDQVNLF